MNGRDVTSSGFCVCLGRCSLYFYLYIYIYVHNPSNRRTQEKYMIIFRIQCKRRHKKCRDSVYLTQIIQGSNLNNMQQRTIYVCICVWLSLVYLNFRISFVSQFEMITMLIIIHTVFFYMCLAKRIYISFKTKLFPFAFVKLSVIVTNII